MPWRMLCALFRAVVVVLALNGTQARQRLKLPDSRKYSQPRDGLQGVHAPNGRQDGKPWIELISWHPRAFIYHNLLTDEECDSIIEQARPKMMRSEVVGVGNQPGEKHEIRTSYGAFLNRRATPVLRKVEETVSNWTKLPVVHQEDMNVLRYGVGQKYGAHMDVLNKHDEGPRVATVLVYLSDVPEGGETAFPKSKWMDPRQAERNGPYSDCAAGHVAHKPKKGSALLFYSLNPDGSQDPLSEHTGCPVIRGVKWTGTIWIHSQPFRARWFGKNASSSAQEWDPEVCQDLHKDCALWAGWGECTKNSGYMLGESIGQVGHCRLSCNRCTVCRPKDAACRAQNRLRAGFLPLDAE